MLAKLSVLLLVLATGFTAGAVTLKPIPDPKDDLLQTGQPQIPCDQIVTRMVEYQRMVSAQESSLTSFLNDVSTKISGWYDQLSPLEGTQQTIAAGTFAPVKDGADKISTLTDMASDNTEVITLELQNIVASLRACSISPLPAPLK